MQRVSLQAISLLLITIFLNSTSLAIEQQTLPDPGITHAVEKELASDPSIAASLEVETKQGIVILRGQVEHLLAQERAAKRSMRVKGVRAVVNNLYLKPVGRTDQELLHDVQRALFLDPVTEVQEIRVQVKDGTVTLQGTVDSWQEMYLGEEVVKKVPGVKRVVNDITINSKIQRSDKELQEEIQRRLAADVWVDANVLEVQVQDGHVTLKGVVSSRAEKTQAALDAFVMGVQSVDDRGIQVDPERQQDMRRVMPVSPKNDAEIARTATAALHYDPRLRDMVIKVSVVRGVATLTGTVDTLEAKQAAEQDARNTLGVWHVWNHLRVSPPELQSRARMPRPLGS